MMIDDVDNCYYCGNPNNTNSIPAGRIGDVHIACYEKNNSVISDSLFTVDFLKKIGFAEKLKNKTEEEIKKYNDIFFFKKNKSIKLTHTVGLNKSWWHLHHDTVLKNKITIESIPELLGGIYDIGIAIGKIRKAAEIKDKLGL